MRLSEFVSSLEDLQEKYGDMDVMIHTRIQSSFLGMPKVDPWISMHVSPWIPMHMDCVNVVPATDDTEAVAYIKGAVLWPK